MTNGLNIYIISIKPPSAAFTDNGNKHCYQVSWGEKQIHWQLSNKCICQSFAPHQNIDLHDTIK